MSSWEHTFDLLKAKQKVVVQPQDKSGEDIDYASPEGHTKLRGLILQTIAQQKLKKHPFYDFLNAQDLARYRKMFVKLSTTDKGQQKLTDFYNRKFAKKSQRLPNIPPKEKWSVVPKGDVDVQSYTAFKRGKKAATGLGAVGPIKEKSMFISAKDRLDKSMSGWDIFKGVDSPDLGVASTPKIRSQPTQSSPKVAMAIHAQNADFKQKNMNLTQVDDKPINSKSNPYPDMHKDVPNRVSIAGAGEMHTLTDGTQVQRHAAYHEPTKSFVVSHSIPQKGDTPEPSQEGVAPSNLTFHGKDRVYHGPHQVYKNGVLRSHTNIANGKREGPEVRFHHDGALASVNNHKDNVRVGETGPVDKETGERSLPNYPMGDMTIPRSSKYAAMKTKKQQVKLSESRARIEIAATEKKMRKKEARAASKKAHAENPNLKYLMMDKSMGSWEQTFDLLKGISNYTYGVGEKSGEEWKAHELKQAKKLKAYKTAQASAPALTSEALHTKYNSPEQEKRYRALHTKYNSPEWQERYNALREKYPVTKKGMSSWEQTFDLLKGHRCKGCVKCEGKAHHDEGGKRMKKGLISWFDSADTLYKSVWEEANGLLKAIDSSKEEYKDLTGKTLFSQTKGTKLSSLVKEHKEKPFKIRGVKDKKKQFEMGGALDEKAHLELAHLKGPKALKRYLKTYVTKMVREDFSGVTRETAKTYYTELLRKYDLIDPPALAKKKIPKVKLPRVGE